MQIPASNSSQSTDNTPYNYLLNAQVSGSMIMGDSCQVVSATLNTLESGFTARLSEPNKPDIYIESTESLNPDNVTLHNVKIKQGGTHWIAPDLQSGDFVDILRTRFFARLGGSYTMIDGRSSA